MEEGGLSLARKTPPTKPAGTANATRPWHGQPAQNDHDRIARPRLSRLDLGEIWLLINSDLRKTCSYHGIGEYWRHPTGTLQSSDAPPRGMRRPSHTEQTETAINREKEGRVDPDKE